MCWPIISIFCVSNRSQKSYVASRDFKRIIEPRYKLQGRLYCIILKAVESQIDYERNDAHLTAMKTSAHRRRHKTMSHHVCRSQAGRGGATWPLHRYLPFTAACNGGGNCDYSVSGTNTCPGSGFIASRSGIMASDCSEDSLSTTLRHHTDLRRHKAASASSPRPFHIFSVTGIYARAIERLLCLFWGPRKWWISRCAEVVVRVARWQVSTDGDTFSFGGAIGRRPREHAPWESPQIVLR